MSLIIPARMFSTENSSSNLENKFSVAIQTLPIESNEFDEIQKYSDILNASPDYQINYFLMSVATSIFPDWILKILINSKHATMVMSNLPGPTFAVKVNGHKFENVGFFIPALGRTAVGFSILSYDGKMHFGIMSDEAAIDSEEDLEFILNGIVSELLKMSQKFLK